jgi:pyruvate formate lyase activating enzyme
MISRRDFLATWAKLFPIIGGLGTMTFAPCWQKFLLGENSGLAFGETYLDEMIRSAPKARYWIPIPSEGRGNKEGQSSIKCLLCANGCVISNGQRGRCRTRINVNGELRSLVYGRPISVHIDPIEKKPLYHYLPGSAAFSLATAGCVLKCKFCQNWQISQSSPEDHRVAFTRPGQIVTAAHTSKAPVIAFTYNEPTVFTEYLTDIARAAKKRGIRCALISCGFMTEEPLREMCEVLGAIKIDLKGYSDNFYRSACGAKLQPVLRSIKQVSKSGVHLEIVNLVVPTLNDSDKMMEGLIDWILGEVGPDVPVHFTRFHPDYQLLNLPPTPVAALERAYNMAMSKGMHYPYVGNVPGHPGNNTYCPKCRKVIIERQGFFINAVNMKNGRCNFCKQKIAGVWA